MEKQWGRTENGGKMPAPARPIARVGVAEKIRDTLRNRIIWGDIHPGTRLLENNLAQEFGISRTPIRQALHLLEAEGMVERNSSGLAVMPFESTLAVETLLIRELLEPIAAEQGIPHLTESDLVRLRSILFEMKAFMESTFPSPKRGAQLNAELHSLLNAKCPYRRLIETIESARDMPGAFWLYSSYTPEDVNRVYQEHVEIVEVATRIVEGKCPPETIKPLIAEHMQKARLILTERGTNTLGHSKD